MFNGRIGLRHVRKGLRHCPETVIRGQQSIHASFDICFCDSHYGLHSDADELLQQSFEPILHLNVSEGLFQLGALLIHSQRKPTLLRYLHHRHLMCLFHPLPGLQHYRCRQHHLPPQRLPRHICRGILTKPVPGRPRRTEDAEWPRHGWRTHGRSHRAANAPQHADAEEHEPGERQVEYQQRCWAQ